MTLQRYGMKAWLTVTLLPEDGGGTLTVTVTQEPYVGVDSFHAMQVGIERIRDAHHELGELERVELIRLGPVTPEARP